ncbi:MAG: hypothetical protein ACRDTR_03210 [Rubrobacter sp.]
MSPHHDEKKSVARTRSIGKGVYVVKGAAPKAGTRLTRDRIADNFRSLNRGEARPGLSEG